MIVVGVCVMMMVCGGGVCVMMVVCGGGGVCM